MDSTMTHHMVLLHTAIQRWDEDLGTLFLNASLERRFDNTFANLSELEIGAPRILMGTVLAKNTAYVNTALLSYSYISQRVKTNYRIMERNLLNNYVDNT